MKCGLDSGGCVCVWWAAAPALVCVALLPDEPFEPAPEVEVDAAAVELADEDAEVDAAAVELADEAAVVEAGAADDDVLGEVEWLPDPHPATTSAATSAAVARLTMTGA